MGVGAVMPVLKSRLRWGDRESFHTHTHIYLEKNEIGKHRTNNLVM